MDEQTMWDEMMKDVAWTKVMAAELEAQQEAEFRALEERGAFCPPEIEIDWSITTAHDESGD